MTTKYKIKKTTGFIFDYLTNMSKFIAAHPVIYKMEYLGENKYKVFEALKLGFIPYSFTYSATIEIFYESKQVVMTAVFMKVNTIEMVFDIKEVEDFAIIKEVITFKTKLPIKSILGQVFKKQHAQLFKNIENSIV